MAREPLPLATAFQPFGAGFWRALCDRVVLETKDLTERGIGANGRAFRPYTQEYATRKAKGKTRRQSSTQVAPVNLELTGDTRNDFKTLSAGPNGGVVGWPTRGGVVLALAEGGRRMIGRHGGVFNSQVDRLIRAEVLRMFRLQINRTRGTRVFRVGK